MKKVLRNSLWALLVLCGITFFSCRRSQPSWDTNILAPIVNTSLSINNLLTSTYLKSNPDSSVTLVYSDSLYNLNMDTLLNIPDTTLDYIEYDIIPGMTTITPGSNLIPSTPQSTLYNFGSVQLKKGVIQSGYLNFYIRNPLSQTVDYTYTVLNVTNVLTGDTLKLTYNVPAETTIYVQKSMAGYNVDFTGINHDSYNTIITQIQAILDPSASAITIPYGDSVVYAIVSFTNIIPYFVKGYFGTTTKSFRPDGAAFPIFNNIIAGNLNLQDVDVTLTLVNGFGIDARLTLSELTSKNNRTGPVKLIDNQILNTAINVNRATQTYNSPPASPVNASSQTFSITPTNSNILNWIDNLPDSVIYDLQVTTDPLGNVSGSNDFAYYGYGIQAYLNITVPLSLIATNLTLVDTVAANFGSTGNGQNVKSGTLTLYAVNGFPFSAGMQLYLLSTTNKVIDSLFIPSQTIAMGNMNSNGVVVSPVNSTLTVSLNAARTQELLNAKKIVMMAVFNMGCESCLPPQYRKIYNYYKLNLKLVGNIDYEIN